MNTEQLLNAILPILHSVKEDKEKLQRILDFLLDEIYETQDETKSEIPEKYRDLVHSVAESTECGFVCFINPETLEVEELPKQMFDDPHEYHLLTGVDVTQEKFLHHDWEIYISVEPRESHDSFQIMEKFADTVNDNKLRNKLINALNNKKPFANFKNIVESSAYRNDWFAFKQKQLEWLVWEELQVEFDKFENNELPYHEEINGFYNDDGTKIDPESVPIPGLCVICRKYQIDDWDENLLCLMNRYDQRNEKDFQCGAFEEL